LTPNCTFSPLNKKRIVVLKKNESEALEKSEKIFNNALNCKINCILLKEGGKREERKQRMEKLAIN
jgi:hypothetical protein